MCGRYALGIRATFVRYQLQQQGMRVDNAPDDEEVRETYNFPPGAYGLVYRAEVPDNGLRDETDLSNNDPPDLTEAASNERESIDTPTTDVPKSKSFSYQLKAMKWGLIPFWTKRSPDYGSMLKTINCRDDSLIENRGMWTTMKQRKRCIVIAQGFYEWLKTGPGGKEKIPHFVKRKDGNLMCLAGLWDCVKYENTEEKLYTYSIITTDSNKQLSFLHDRMPVILEPNSESMKLWLNPTQNKWNKSLQSMLRPYEGDLDCYPVNKDVGKVGNNSPDFIVPIDSKENKKNIANFFSNAVKHTTSSKTEKEEAKMQVTNDVESSENHAPIPMLGEYHTSLKRKHSEDVKDEVAKVPKLSKSPVKNSSPLKTSSTKHPRSATSNEGSTMKSSPAKKGEAGVQKITNFFVK